MRFSKFWLILLIVSATSAGAQQNQPVTMEKADALFQKSEWQQAAGMYERIVSAKPENGQAWLRLGHCAQNLNQHAKAVEAYLSAEQNGISGIALWAATAYAYAGLGKKDNAYAALERAVGAGLSPKTLESAKALESMRGEDRFTALVQRADSIAYPCKYDARSRQFDFWVGEWDVYVAGRKRADSSIQNLLKGCMVLENYTVLGEAYIGKSMNFFDVGLGKWQQIWTDQSGVVSRYTGELRGKEMHFWGKNTNRDGSESDVRMVFTPNEDGSVRQLFEGSQDGGKTWNVLFDGIYRRKAAAAPGTGSGD